MRKSEFAIFLLTAAFLQMAWSGSWFEIVAEGTYTEGLDREPTIRTQYLVDSSQESFEMSIENSTPLLLYWLEREDVSPAPTNQNENSSEPPADTPSLDGDSEPCSGSCLDRARSWVGLTMFALFATLYLSSVRPSTLTRATVVLVWLLGTVVILTAVPLAAAADFGISGDEDSEGESSTGGFDTNTQETVEVDQFAHFEQDGDMGLSFDGISFTYDSVGFDLGLLAEEDRQAVIDSAPAEGEPGYESLIAFHGELSIGPGTILTWWLFTAPLVIVSLRNHRELLEEE
jgi:hypothetical protein